MAFDGFLGNIMRRFKGTFGGPEEEQGNPLGNQPPNTLGTGQSRTQLFEGGHKEKAYLDSLGKPTIGTGTLLDNQSYDAMPEHYATMNWSKEEGDKQFNTDYDTKKSEVQRLYGDNWGDLPQEAQDVMTDMAYNVGSEGLFNKFPGLIKDIKAGDYGKAANQLKYKDPSKGDAEGNTSNWWNQVGGAKTEGNIASGAWAADSSRAANRGTYNFDALNKLGNSIQNNVVNEQGSEAFNY